MKGFDNVGSELPFKLVQIENAEHQREVRSALPFPERKLTYPEADPTWAVDSGSKITKKNRYNLSDT